MFFCPYVYILKDRRTEEQKIKGQRGRTKKLMFLCSYVKKENTHKNLCSFVLMSKRKNHPIEPYIQQRPERDIQ